MLLGSRNQEGAGFEAGGGKIEMGTTEDGGATGQAGKEEAVGTG
jgi:hypothetical protein